MICSALLLASLIFIMGFAQGNVNFYAIGDWGDPWFKYQQWTADAMAEYAAIFNPEFIVAFGDNFYQNGIHSLNDSKIDNQWRYVYNHTTLKDLVWYLAIGNHDYGFGVGEEWYEVNLTFVEPLWEMPHLWHTFTKTDEDVRVQFIMIDTEALKSRQNNYTDMMTWLEDELAAATADWVLVCGHHPIYSCAEAGPISGTMHAEVLPILERYSDQVDVYFAGHDHDLQLLQQINDTDHFDYVISGAAGAFLDREIQTFEDILRNDYGVQKTFFETTFGFTTVSASKTELQLEFFDQNMTLLYEYARPKPDNGRPRAAV